MAKFADQVLIQPTDFAAAGQAAASGIACRVQLDSTRTSKSGIGMKVRAAQTTTNTSDIIGGEISARVNDDIDVANTTGLHVDTYLRGTTAKTISGDVRALEVELVTDDAGNNDLIWDSDYSTEPADENGGFKVRINGADRWVKTYSTAPIE